MKYEETKKYSVDFTKEEMDALSETYDILTEIQNHYPHLIFNAIQETNIQPCVKNRFYDAFREAEQTEKNATEILQAIRFILWGFTCCQLKEFKTEISQEN